ncbi:hypothetical protein LTS08_007077 [Lithohypha guttulata]|uniref:Uncharacterized protein n=1 Tax=Lithohypha guttulata TaxID=1690604 RepID=A0AAN7T2B7_9EURO|nr:hypothetical protein LTR05_003835 [Lithohypha guttulata]KAK5097057.1 hypothetical protein LTS08_007077 [Lithohypha guttulata]
MCVVVPPGPGLRRPPSFDKFPPGATLWIALNRDGTAKDIKVIPKKPEYDNLRELDSFGASKEEIFYFESWVLTYKLLGLSALAQTMEKDVKDFDKHEIWQTKITALNKSIKDVSEEAAELYDLIGNDLHSDDSAEATTTESKVSQSDEASQ